MSCVWYSIPSMPERTFHLPRFSPRRALRTASAYSPVMCMVGPLRALRIGSIFWTWIIAIFGRAIPPPGDGREPEDPRPPVVGLPNRPGLARRVVEVREAVGHPGRPVLPNHEPDGRLVELEIPALRGGDRHVLPGAPQVELEGGEDQVALASVGPCVPGEDERAAVELRRHPVTEERGAAVVMDRLLLGILQFRERVPGCLPADVGEVG